MNSKPILHLNLKTNWFELIYSGEKKEEYREIKPFWNRIFSSNIKIKGKFYHPTDVIICFSNGYSKTRKQMFLECTGMLIREGKQEWGAEPGKRYYVLKLGNIIKNEN